MMLGKLSLSVASRHKDRQGKVHSPLQPEVAPQQVLHQDWVMGFPDLTIGDMATAVHGCSIQALASVLPKAMK